MLMRRVQTLFKTHCDVSHNTGGSVKILPLAQINEVDASEPSCYRILMRKNKKTPADVPAKAFLDLLMQNAKGNPEVIGVRRLFKEKRWKMNSANIWP